MARVVGKPGHNEAFIAMRRAFLAAVGLPTGALAVVALMAIGEGNPTGISATVILWLVVVGFGLRWIRLDLKKTGADWRSVMRSAEHETGVAHQLHLLPDTFAVFHGFRFSSTDRHREGWNIDHVVVGPAGVFAVAALGDVPAEIGPPGGAARPDRVGRLTKSAKRLSDLLARALPRSEARLDVPLVLAGTPEGDVDPGGRDAGYEKTVVPIEGLANAIGGAGAAETGDDPGLGPDEVHEIALTILGEYDQDTQNAFREVIEAL